jgi:hypothetical protein
VDLHDAVVDPEATSSLRQDDGLVEVWRTSPLLGVNSHHAQLFPNLLQQDIEPELHMDRDASIARVLRDLIDLLNGDGIDLVINVDALDVLPIALDHIDKLINVVVAPEGNMSVVHLVLVHDVHHHLLVNLGQLAIGVELHTSGLLFLDGDVGL